MTYGVTGTMTPTTPQGVTNRVLDPLAPGGVITRDTAPTTPTVGTDG